MILPFALPATRLPHSRGFSLIELVVTVGILTVITGALLANHASFGGSILVENLAYDVALSLRQAQVFGLSVREFNTGSGQFDIGYGIHFDRDDLSTYRLFADIDKGKTFNAGDGTEEIFTIGRGYSIRDICATSLGGVEVCSSTGALQNLDVVFIRPDPDAIMRVNGDTASVYQRARIVVQSPQEKTREVSVEATGQISVSQQ
ncbi:hypothetical protein A3D62_02330 [Candidatus Kaiserbacteria bacterium RIFCSPHIGHO2_02_FULL_49_11]|uniref:General secretion pathway GspH domain-containing protein n=1 Tax=Candidatus Kaiserbacteria bacterium RIFCSPHIGHO2_02_FULL_49_11 TaxID=1798489 RepID=A0A1F6D2U3_9BACT|nr:MAG: hypothetical protein A3D62_02330 [Candidatus Kaiserbacteria bacterium RIFCSPHIGHO2_02_FULL_49_11]